MTRRDGFIEASCQVRVSEEMKNLRTEQSGLNYFLWSSELSYGFTLTSDDPRLSAGDELVSKALSNVSTEAWYPNTAGRIKYNAKVASFREQLRVNQTMVVRATMVMWYTNFERFLKARLGSLTNSENWGPFTRSLNIQALTQADVPVRLQTVLRADFCRHLRNLMAHREEAALPDTLNHPQTQGWIRSRVRDGEKPNDVKAAAEYVVGQAEAHLKDCAKNDKDLPLSFFYTLFAFTNFDSLAFEIEEALMPMNSNSTTTIRRQVRKVRRADLVQQDANPTLPTELA